MVVHISIVCVLISSRVDHIKVEFIRITVTQSSPHAPYLFFFFAKPMSFHMRNIRGLRLLIGEECLVQEYADDKIFYLEDDYGAIQLKFVCLD